jgi:hypothetical protein
MENRKESFSTAVAMAAAGEITVTEEAVSKRNDFKQLNKFSNWLIGVTSQPIFLLLLCSTIILINQRSNHI